MPSLFQKAVEYLCGDHLNLFDFFFFTFQNKLIPEEHKDNAIAHVVKVHESVGDYSVKYLQKLRRLNYVTPKNYLDFVGTYTKLLEEKDKYVLDQVSILYIY